MAPPDMMTAAILETYGVPLRLAQVARPEPEAGQIPVRFSASRGSAGRQPGKSSS